MKLKPIPLLLLLPALMVLVACGGASEPTPDIEATVEARLAEARIEATVQAKLEEEIAADAAATATAEAIARASVHAAATAYRPPSPTRTSAPVATPTPTARVVEKEVVTATPTATPTFSFFPPAAPPTPMPTATPTPTPTATPLEAFEGTIHITSQTGVMVHEVKWSLINNSRQDVTLVNTGIYNDSGLMVGKVISGESRLAAGRDSLATTTFMNATEEQVMTYQFVWTFRMHTGETIVCTFSITNPKSCLRSLID